jgi:hypothetical protein
MRGEIPTKIRYAPGIWRHSAPGRIAGEGTHQGQEALCHVAIQAGRSFRQYHNEVEEMQAKSDDLIRKNKSLHQKNKGMPL